METKTCPKEVAVCIRELNGVRLYSARHAKPRLAQRSWLYVFATNCAALGLSDQSRQQVIAFRGRSCQSLGVFNFGIEEFAESGCRNSWIMVWSSIAAEPTIPPSNNFCCQHWTMRQTATETGSNQQAVQRCFMLSPSGCSTLLGQFWVTQSIQAAIHSAVQLEQPQTWFP